MTFGGEPCRSLPAAGYVLHQTLLNRSHLANERLSSKTWCMDPTVIDTVATLARRPNPQVRRVLLASPNISLRHSSNMTLEETTADQRPTEAGWVQAPASCTSWSQDVQGVQ